MSARLALLLALSAGLPAPRAAADELPAAAPARPEPFDAPAERLEPGGLPAIAYDSDIGLLLGGLFTAARFAPGYQPYRWRLEGLLSVATKRNAQGDLGLPFHYHYLRLDLPGLRENTLRIQALAQYRRFSNTGWYGFGNGSGDEVPAGPSGEPIPNYFRYQRIEPSIDVQARFMLWSGPGVGLPRRLELLTGGTLSYQWMRFYGGSLLEQQVAQVRAGSGPDAEALRANLFGFDPHWRLSADVGLLWDSRDHEYFPSQGLRGELSLRASPGTAEGGPFAGLHLSGTGFVPLAGPELVLGLRGVGDVSFGDVPLDQLVRVGAASTFDAPGGANSLRGVLRQRWAGRIKLFANSELRAILREVRRWGQRFRLGLSGFFDVGRVWSDLTPVRLGGRSVDRDRLATGLGAGLRIGWGETLVIRVDYGSSPSDGTAGFYVDIGQVF